MNTNGNKGNVGRGRPLHLDDPPNSELPGVPPSESSDTSANSEIKGGPVADSFVAFATRADIRGTDGVDKRKLAILGGGLAIAVLFFVFTAVVGRSPKKQMSREQPSQTTKQNDSQQPKGRVTPVMESVRTPAPDNANGQLSPSDIRRTRSSGGGGAANVNSPVGHKPMAGKSTTVGSLGNVPSFADTQQKWEEPRPYGESAPPPPPQNQQQKNALKEPSLIFVRNHNIERQTVNAFAAPLQEMKQAAGFVRQSLKEVSWLLIGLMISAGLVLGLMLGYWPMRSSQNNMQEQLNRIEQYLAAQQPAASAPAALDPHAPAHKGKVR